MFRLGKDVMTSEALATLSRSGSSEWQVADQTWKHARAMRAKLLAKADSATPVYGVSTGFGYLSNVQISPEERTELQRNIIRSHACGIGNPLTPEQTRAALFLKAHHLLMGHSGASESCLTTLIGFLTHDILPLVPHKGSVGASGDLAPLSHLALGLLGEGRALFEGEIVPTKYALEKCDLKPLVPEAKDGLALINGTEFMCALANELIVSVETLLQAATAASALSLSAFRGTKRAFDSRIHAIRHQIGQRKVAAHLRLLLAEGDEIGDSHNSCDRVQDPYSFRCIPQVHGPAWDIWNFAQTIVERELESITDNPIVCDNGDVISGGNFHGQCLALAMDSLALGVSELGSLSQCRVEQLIDPRESRQPAFLIERSGLNSGFMIPQVVAASLVAENRVLCTPASTDNVPTSAGKEDHVSFGPLSCFKLLTICDNLAHILAIEMLAACQGIDLLKPLRPSKNLRNLHAKIRELSPFLAKDRALDEDIEKVAQFVRTGEFSKWIIAAPEDVP
jgi:histidine ammonia-lyase